MNFEKLEVSPFWSGLAEFVFSSGFEAAFDSGRNDLGLEDRTCVRAIDRSFARIDERDLEHQTRPPLDGSANNKFAPGEIDFKSGRKPSQVARF